MESSRHRLCFYRFVSPSADSNPLSSYYNRIQKDNTILHPTRFFGFKTNPHFQGWTRCLTRSTVIAVP